MLGMAEITFAIALMGAVLGIMNTWRAYDRDKVKLLVIPQLYGSTDEGLMMMEVVPKADSGFGRLNPRMEEKELRFCIEVVNLSTFPVIISEVGFLSRWFRERFWLSDYVMTDDRRLPLRLEPRASLVVFAKESFKALKVVVEFQHAYAKTNCREVRRGTSHALKMARKWLRAKAK